METLFLPHRLAIKMKELGFNEPCFATYRHDERFNEYELDYHTKSQMQNNCIPINTEYTEESKWISAPLYQQAFDWFRYKGFQISIWVDPEEDDACMSEIFYDKQYLFESREYRPYKEARQECLEKLIEKFGELKNKL